MFEVVKRDGQVVDFTIVKIKDAIAKAFTATGKEYNDDIIDMLCLRVTANFQAKIENGQIHVEEIQDSVETVLEQSGYTDVAKAYITYRQKRAESRDLKNIVVEVDKTMDEYL